MKHAMLIKGGLIVLLALLLWVPLQMIEATIAERTQYRSQAVQTIAASSAGEQKLWGPVLSVTVDEEYDDEASGWRKATAAGSKAAPDTVRRTRHHTINVHPQAVHLAGTLAVEKRGLGLYSTPVFELTGTLAGQFAAPAASDLGTLGPNARLTWGVPTVTVGLTDPRGIAGAPRVELDGQVLQIQSLQADNASDAATATAASASTASAGRTVGNRGLTAASMKTGFKAVGRADYKPAKPTADTTALPPIAFKVEARIAGTSSFAFVPLGQVSTAALQSNWAHPSFGGDFLPRERSVQSKGFTAQWATTGLASNSTAQQGENAQGFSVKLIEPVDIYQQAARSVKYGILFIALSFAVFFLFEQLKALRIHPIQYLLVGLAQAVFFLLLTSLSEHIAFALAYGASALASVLLVGVYLAAVLRSAWRALGFSAAMVLLYAALFGILQSEQNALLLGSVLLFTLLAALMLGTRRVDWYSTQQAGRAS